MMDISIEEDKVSKYCVYSSDKEEDRKLQKAEYEAGIKEAKSDRLCSCKEII